MRFALTSWLARDGDIDRSRAFVDSCSVRAVCGGTQTEPNPASSVSLDGVAERVRVVSDPCVTRDDRDECRRLAELLRSRQMHGVEGANRLHRERTADASENRVSDTDEVTLTREDLEPSYRRAFVRHTLDLHC